MTSSRAGPGYNQSTLARLAQRGGGCVSWPVAMSLLVPTVLTSLIEIELLSWDHHGRCVECRYRVASAGLLDGFGHLDRYRAIRDGAPFEGITVRLFDPATAQWSIHWADTRYARTFLPPMTGRFLGGVGEFYGEESVRGKTVWCRFLWTRPQGDVARW